MTRTHACLNTLGFMAAGALLIGTAWMVGNSLWPALFWYHGSYAVALGIHSGFGAIAGLVMAH